MSLVWVTIVDGARSGVRDAASFLVAAERSCSDGCCTAFQVPHEFFMF